MNDHGHKVVHSVRVHGVVGRVEQTELQWKHDPMGDLDVSVVLLHVLESLQVQRQDGGQFLHPHPLMSLLGHECLLLKTGGLNKVATDLV